MFAYLPDDGLDVLNGDAHVVGADDELQEVAPQYLEHHANICMIVKHLST